MSTIIVTGDYVVPSPPQDLTFDAGASADFAAYTLQITPPFYGMSFTDNDVTIEVTSSQNSGSVEGLFDTQIPDYHTDTITIAAAAALSVSATGSNSTAYGFYGYSGELGVFLVNDGHFTVSAASQATGAYIGGGGTFTNDSVFSVSSAGPASGLYMSYGGSFTNTGQFTVSGATASGIYFGDGANTPADILNTGTVTVTSEGNVSGFVLDNISSGSFVNSGTITVTRTAGSWLAIDIEGVDASDAPYAITNSGAINGLIYADSSHSTRIDVTNTGTLFGGIVLNRTTTTHALSGYDNEIHNSGAITGDIYLGGYSNDLYDGRGGTLDGRIILRGGNDTVFLGDDGGTVFGSDLGASGHITGGAGADYIVFDNSDGAFVINGGAGDDTLGGGGGNDVIDGGAGNDFMDGGGGVNTVTYASATAGVSVNLSLQYDETGQTLGQNTIGAGTDLLSHFQNLTGSAFNDTLEGDSHDNVLTGGAGADTFVMSAGGGHDTIADFSHAQGDRIDLSPVHAFFSLADVLAAASQSGADTVIDLGGGNSVRLANVQLADLTAADFVFAPIVVTAPDEVVTIGAGANLTSTGDDLIRFGLPALTNATVVNHGSLSLTSSSAAYLIDAVPSTYGGGTFENHGAVSFQAAGGAVAICRTVDNLGSITATSTQDATGMFANLVNSGTVTVQGATLGVGVSAIDLVQNLAGAVLSVASTSGQVTGAQLSNGGEFDNAGALTVTGSATATATAYGVDIRGIEYGPGASIEFSLVNNSGNIAVSGAAGVGVEVESSEADLPAADQYTLINSGTITAETAIQFSRYPAAVGVGAAVDNSGVLNGLVQLSNNADRLLNIGTINGDVDLGAGDDTLDSRLGKITGAVTLGSGSSTVTLGAENNTIALAAGTHVVDGGGGINTVSYVNAASGVGVSLASPGHTQWTGVGLDTLNNIQHLIGSSWSDTLEGGGSASTALTGGLNADVFVYRPGDGAVTITDFSHAQGDRIDLSAFGGLGAVLANAAQVGSDTVISLPGGGTLTLDGVSLASLQASDFLPSVPSTIDNAFGGGSISGVAFLNLATGDLGYMTANPSGGETWHPLGPTSTAYAVIAKGDFNGDGMADIAFRSNTTGDWGFMSVNPAGGETWHDAGPTSLAYTAMGEGDFGGDGQVGIAFRSNATGAWGYMTANTSGGETWHDVGPTSLAYGVAGIGDFDGSGHDSIAFRNDATGDFGFMSASPSGEIWHPLGPTSTAYAAVGFGDFDGDGVLDVAFRNTSTGDWGFMSISPAGEIWHGVGPTSTAYSVIGAADYDGDGKTELAFRDAAGDWGFMGVDASGHEVWHGVGATSTAYMAL